MSAQPDSPARPARPALWHRYGFVAYLAVFTGVLGHASSEFAAKLISANSDINGPEISVWRFFLGGTGLVLVALALPSSRDLATPLRRHGPALMAFSVFGVALAYLFFHWSLDYASVPQVATVVTTAPIFVGLINLAVNKVPISTAKMVSGAGAVLGVALLVTDGALAGLGGEWRSLFGIFLAILCALFMSVYLVLIKPLIAEYGALRITAITLFTGGAVLWLAVGIAFGRWADFSSLFTLAPTAAIAIIVLALYNTTITQWLWIGGLAAAPDITRAIYLFFLKPVLAALLAVYFLGTTLTIWQIAAIAVICGAVAAEAFWDKMFKPKVQP